LYISLIPPMRATCLTPLIFHLITAKSIGYVFPHCADFPAGSLRLTWGSAQSLKYQYLHSVYPPRQADHFESFLDQLLGNCSSYPSAGSRYHGNTPSPSLHRCRTAAHSVREMPCPSPYHFERKEASLLYLPRYKSACFTKFVSNIWERQLQIKIAFTNSLNSGNASYHSVKNLLSSCLLFKNLKD
jgi:hypothetical protein